MRWGHIWVLIAGLLWKNLTHLPTRSPLPFPTSAYTEQQPSTGHKQRDALKKLNKLPGKKQDLGVNGYVPSQIFPHLGRWQPLFQLLPVTGDFLWTVHAAQEQPSTQQGGLLKKHTMPQQRKSAQATNINQSNSFISNMNEQQRQLRKANSTHRRTEKKSLNPEENRETIEKTEEEFFSTLGNLLNPRTRKIYLNLKI